MEPRQSSVIELTMKLVRINNSAPAPVQCPRCAQRMQLVRKTIRFNELPDLFEYKCKKCGMSHYMEHGAADKKTPNRTHRISRTR